MDKYLYYKKVKNSHIFEYLEKSELSLHNLQNYIPIYNKFFNLNEDNYNNINLNQKYSITKVQSIINRNTISGFLSNTENNQEIEKHIFIKFSPLLDPLKYLTGKYDTNNEKIFALPGLNNNHDIIPKLYDINNSAYVDGFFTYLSSLLLNNFNFTNGLDYYGSYLGNKENFYYNIVDDIEYLNESSFFHENKNTLFKIENDYYNDLFNIDSRSKKHKLNISNKSLKIETDELSIINNEETDNHKLNELNIVNLEDLKLDNTIFNCLVKKNSSRSCSESSFSSKSSNTNDSQDNEDTNNSLSSIDNDEIESSCCSDEDEEDIFIMINNFPTQLICIEKCENTLDDLMVNNKLNNDEWISALMQVIMMLITYQNTFSFTHNDLHTNNIMYNKTDKK